MKNDVKLQVLVSEELNKKLIQRINKIALKENKKARQKYLESLGYKITRVKI